jgi:hypothetical protein
MMRRALVTALLLALPLACGACAKKSDRAGSRAEDRDRSAPPGTGAAPAPLPRHHALAEKVLAAVASGDFQKLAALAGKASAAELGELNEGSFRRLREKLAFERIDLAKATISRVEVTGDRIELVDVFVNHGGKMFQLHFSAMESRGAYTLLAIADWLRPA